MKRRSLLIALLVCLAALAALSGCITVTIPHNPGSSPNTPSSTTAPQTPASTPSTTTANPGARPVITSFSASPAAVNIGVASTLSWSVSGADSVSIDQGVGGVALSGSRTVLPAATTVYTLTATNSTGSNMAATQIVVSTATPTPTPSYNLPVVNYFTASPALIDTGEYTSLSWDVSNATNVNITPGIGAVGSSGSLSVQPSQNTTFTIMATGPGGSASYSTTIKVSSYQPTVTPSWTGTWLLTTVRGWEGRMYLSQAGNIVTGTYEYQNGHITGTVSGLTLTGSWSEEPTYAPPDDAGSFTVTIYPDGSYWYGTWQYSPSSTHTGGTFEAYRQ